MSWFVKLKDVGLKMENCGRMLFLKPKKMG
jgi:hypothetical protein